MKTTLEFDEWLKSIKGVKTKSSIKRHLNKLEKGLGDTKRLQNSKLYELRIHDDGGYRAYYVYATEYNNEITLIYGGRKNSQLRDIEKAEKILGNL